VPCEQLPPSLSGFFNIQTVADKAGQIARSVKRDKSEKNDLIVNQA
jgi:osmotically-inducible protein OsmY